MNSELPPNLLTELEWRFRNGRGYDTRRIAGQAKTAITELIKLSEKQDRTMLAYEARITELKAKVAELEKELAKHKPFVPPGRAW